MRTSLFGFDTEKKKYAQEKDLLSYKRKMVQVKNLYSNYKKWIPTEKKHEYEIISLFYSFLTTYGIPSSRYSSDDRFNELHLIRSELYKSVEGITPNSSMLRVYADTIEGTQNGVDETILFIDSILKDLTYKPFQTYSDLQVYMRGKSGSMVIMLSFLFSIELNTFQHQALIAFSEAVQLTNFLQNINQDLFYRRVYFPLDELNAYSLTFEEIKSKNWNPRLVYYIYYQVQRITSLFEVIKNELSEFPEMFRPLILKTIEHCYQYLNCIRKYYYNVFEVKGCFYSICMV